jgi:hypothetical protein
VPLKAARLAVKVIGLLSEAERASRLSFADAIKRLAEEPQGSPLFISKNRDRVERFVVVHGQIFLNQIKAFPKQVGVGTIGDGVRIAAASPDWLWVQPGQQSGSMLYILPACLLLTATAILK